MRTRVAPARRLFYRGAAGDEIRLEQMCAGIGKFEFGKDVAAAAFHAGSIRPRTCTSVSRR